MNDSENNQQPVLNEAFTLKVDPKILLAVVVLVFLAIYFVMTFSQKIENGNEIAIDNSMTMSETEFTAETNTNVPVGFPAEFILEPKATLTEEYSLVYGAAGSVQHTIRYTSKRGVLENLAEYKSVMEQGSWIFVNQFESEVLSALYGLKDGNEVNVTLEQMAGTTDTVVVISFVRGNE